MTPNRPYLIRALFEWILDNDCTPHLVVSALVPGVSVPEAHVDNGRIVLNIAPRAVRNLQIGNDVLTFDGRFGGRSHRITVPISAVIAIYAKETGQGTAFEPEPPTAPPPDEDPDGTPGGHLRVIK